MLNIESKLDWFGKELKYHMKEENMMPRDVSYHCKINSNLISNYIQGKTFPKLWVIVLLSDLFEITVNELLDYDEADDDVLVDYDPFSIFEDEDEFAMHVRNRIEQYMISSHISIQELSERTGFTKSTIRRWLGMSDKQPELPRTSDFLRICDALDCTPSDFLGY